MYLCVCAVLVCCVSCLYSVGSAKINLLDSNPLSVYGTVGDRSGDNIGLVWWGMCMSKQCQREVHVPLIHCATTSHAPGHPCLVSLLFMSSLYSTLLNSQIFLFTCPLSFLYRIHMHCMKQTGYIFGAYTCVDKLASTLRKGRIV